MRTPPFPTLTTPSSAPWVRTNEPLLWLSGTGHERRTREDNYYHDASIRQDVPHIVLQVTLSGAGYYERAGRRTMLRSGMAFFDKIPGPFIYGYPDDATDPYEQVFIGMRGDVAETWWRRIVRTSGHVLNFGHGNPVAPMMLNIARNFRDRSMPDRYVMSGQLYQVLMTVVSALNRSRVAMAPLVTDALDVIARRGCDISFNVAELARELDCSREYLSRQFRASTGVTPLDYLTQHRLKLVAQELRENTEKLDVIAQRTGFGGANYLCRVFRKQYGLTPVEFRRRPWVLA